MWRNEIGLPTFPGALRNQVLFPDTCFAFYLDTAQCRADVKVLSVLRAENSPSVCLVIRRIIESTANGLMLLFLSAFNFNRKLLSLE